MRKLITTFALASAACASNSPSADIGENVSIARQAESTTTTSVHKPELRNLPHFRQSTPGTGDGGSGGTGGGTSSGAWHPLTHQPTTIFAGTSLLLTDGTVMVQDAGTPNWWKLTPDITGSYASGSWTQLASMPDGYAPLYFASAVLPDGRVIVEGGEYQGFVPQWTTRGAVYDPTKDSWTSIAPPTAWETIGDAQSAVLEDGRFMLANCCTTDSAILDPKTLTWSTFGSGKADINDEEGWTLLPNGKLLTIDANNTTDLLHAEIFSPANATWTSAGSTPVQLADLEDDGDGSHELGPQMMRPDGTVFAVGATGHTAIYRVGSGRWSAGPDFPVIPGEGQLDVADGPAALLPNGHVLVVASAGLFNVPAHVFDFDGQALTEIAGPPGAKFDSSYNANLLLLPSGEVLYTDFSNDVEIYTSSGKGKSQWAPQVDDACSFSQLQSGTTYRISGERLNGLSQGVAYGDDAQAATNYPLVRITNRATGHVVYARTHDHSSMSIRNNAASHTFFDVPATAEEGRSDLVVIANGIASSPIEVHIEPPQVVVTPH